MKLPPLMVLGLTLVSLAAAAETRLDDGKRNYQAFCAQCHEQGIDGAPVTGKTEDWVGRSQLWEAVLFEHVQDGYMKMPARGDADHATDYDAETAAEYMMHLNYPSLPTD